MRQPSMRFSAPGVIFGSLQTSKFPPLCHSSGKVGGGERGTAVKDSLAALSVYTTSATMLDGPEGKGRGKGDGMEEETRSPPHNQRCAQSTKLLLLLFPVRPSPLLSGTPEPQTSRIDWCTAYTFSACLLHGAQRSGQHYYRSVACPMEKQQQQQKEVEEVRV